jgi:hypothetical protein
VPFHIGLGCEAIHAAGPVANDLGLAHSKMHQFESDDLVYDARGCRISRAEKVVISRRRFLADPIRQSNAAWA